MRARSEPAPGRARLPRLRGLLPAARLPPRQRAVAFARERVVTVRADELDVQHLEVHRLARSSGEGDSEGGE